MSTTSNSFILTRDNYKLNQWTQKDILKGLIRKKKKKKEFTLDIIRFTKVNLFYSKADMTYLASELHCEQL